MTTHRALEALPLTDVPNIFHVGSKWVIACRIAGEVRAGTLSNEKDARARLPSLRRAVARELHAGTAAGKREAELNAGVQ